ncbi:IS66 family transposase [Polaromonas glacialis]|uniref:IS66 family transposase n=1 Tax=Polaromonas glacialis TaxID=866564 RepID=UPI000494EE70|nr:IS66 family transposase [Polaromonas glacialis]
MLAVPDAQEIDALKEALAQALQRSDALAGELRMVRAERDLLQERLKQFMRKLFAARSEAGSPQQRDLFFNEAEALGAASEPATCDGHEDGSQEVRAHQRVPRGRKPLDAALPREVVRHELPEDQRVCPHDGTALVEIGVETSEQLDIIPQQVRVIRHERVKYACPCCDGALRLASKPAQIIPKGLFSEGLLAWVITSKYCDGLPLYRQTALLSRFGGGDLARNTLAASVVRVGREVQPIINVLRDHLLDSPLIHGDETHVQVLKEAGKSAQSKSYMWVQTTPCSGVQGAGPPIRLFGYAPSRSTAAAQILYAGVQEGSVLMTDGYAVYDAIAQAHHLVHLGCWAHCRRGFHEALQALPRNARGPEQLAARFLALIAQLYAVESRAREHRLPPQELLVQRQQHSVPVLGQIEALLLANVHTVLPGSLLGKALHYLASQWTKLALYVTDGAYPIDNNAAENSIRPFCIGRRNWLFSDTVAGAQASANLYSLLQTCVVNGVDGYAYLRALLTALPSAQTADDYEALLPWRITLPGR